MSDLLGSKHAFKTKAAQMVIWIGLMVLALGLPRFLVVCNGPHCDGHIELTHRSGSCCDREHQAHADDERAHEETAHRDACLPDEGCEHQGCGERDADGDRACQGHRGCVDVALGLDTGPLPERVVLEHDDPPCAVAIDGVAPARLRFATTVVRPPPTGPPRIDQRTALRASTVLLL